MSNARYRIPPSSRPLRLLHNVMRFWPHLLIVAFLISPTGPHLRFYYIYRGGIGSPSFIECTYLGSRGFVTTNLLADCPVFAWLDAGDYR